MKLTDSEIDLLIEALQLKKSLLINQLDEIDFLIEKTRGGVINDNSVSNTDDRQRKRRNSESRTALFEKIKYVMLQENRTLTSREILQLMYAEYPEELDEKDDRKHIASVSSVLYSKVLEGDIAKIEREKEQVKFKLTKDLEYNVLEFEKSVEESQRGGMYQIDEDEELPF